MIQKYLQKCGDYLIVDKKSDIKIRHRYYYEGHFQGYSKTILFRLDSAQAGIVGNPEKPDENGFLCDKEVINKKIYFVWKNIEKRCYNLKYDEYKRYCAKNVKVSEEFKLYSNFEKWYLEMSNGDLSLEVDKDCKSTLLNYPHKLYSKETCLLLPGPINTFISTIGKGIYKTKFNTFCVRLRRKYLKINKNFKTYKEAINYKKFKDFEYLTLLCNEYNVNTDTKLLLKRYIEIL